MYPIEAFALRCSLERPSLSALGTLEGPHKDQVGARYMVHLPVASRNLLPSSQGQAVQQLFSQYSGAGVSHVCSCLLRAISDAHCSDIKQGTCSEQVTKKHRLESMSYLLSIMGRELAGIHSFQLTNGSHHRATGTIGAYSMEGKPFLQAL